MVRAQLVKEQLLLKMKKFTMKKIPDLRVTMLNELKATIKSVNQNLVNFLFSLNNILMKGH